MSRIEEQIEISVARADVFKFCHDLGSWPEWDELVVNAELLSPKPVRRGTLVGIDAKYPNGAVFSWEAEYTEYQMLQNSTLKALDTASTSPFGAGSELAWKFSAVEGGTRVTWVWDYKPRGIIATIVDRLGRGSATQRAIRRSLANLKSMLESGKRAEIN